MPIFPRRPYPTPNHLTPNLPNVVGTRYRALLNNHPFLLFGLPFITLMLAGSFFLTPATAVRYESFDRKTHMLDREEAMGLSRVRDASRRRSGGGKVDIREEYWRLAGKEARLDDWEVKRVERLPGEPDGTL